MPEKDFNSTINERFIQKRPENRLYYVQQRCYTLIDKLKESSPKSHDLISKLGMAIKEIKLASEKPNSSAYTRILYDGLICKSRSELDIDFDENLDCIKINFEDD